ncbi:CDP-alcohol phosphatidyltransferase family protein [Patescibacteria group bacterium]|nr:CDP-alcohol phosphatidyltransferase family protein [Patescibacteria group bacterium]
MSASIKEMLIKEDQVKWTDRILAATLLKLIPRQVTPNQMTIFRFITVPFMALFLYLELYRIALPFFIISFISDAMDGALSRTQNKITTWGKIYDPMADKFLIGITVLILVSRYLGWILALTMIIPELMIGAVTYYKKTFGNIIMPPSIYGRAKLHFQIFGIGFLLLFVIFATPLFLLIAQYLLYISIILALIAFLIYHKL